jgi:hypothetical protein
MPRFVDRAHATSAEHAQDLVLHREHRSEARVD